jgi:septal ring factor EnvC (AmiA/AmiB activator)
MNSKTAAALLFIIALVLGGGLFYLHNNSVEEKKKDSATILQLSNTVSETTMKLEEQKLVNLSLERDFAAQTEDLKSFSNRLAATTAALDKSQADAKAAAEVAKSEILKRDAEIARLEADRDAYTKKMADLTGKIGNLETQIADTQRRLEASEGDRDFLLRELKRLQTEKAELERQFNDLALLRDQVRKLRDELSITRRLEWIRRGLYGSFSKGGELLQKGFATAPSQTNYNLNVELTREGTIRVIPPLTNAPATNLPPRK